MNSSNEIRKAAVRKGWEYTVSGAILHSPASAELWLHISIAILIVSIVLRLPADWLEQHEAPLGQVMPVLAGASFALMAGRIALGVFLGQLFTNMRETLLSQLEHETERLYELYERSGRAGHWELAKNLDILYNQTVHYMTWSEVTNSQLHKFDCFFKWARTVAAGLQTQSQNLDVLYGSRDRQEWFPRLFLEAYHAALATSQTLARIGVNVRLTRSLDRYGPRLLLLLVPGIGGVSLLIVGQTTQLGVAATWAGLVSLLYIVVVGVFHLVGDSIQSFVVPRIFEVAAEADTKSPVSDIR